MIMSLAACGGGGDGGSSNDDSASSGTGDAIDAYMGTTTGACEAAPGVSIAATGAPAYRKFSRTLDTKVSATQATGSVSIAYFSTADCSNAAVYTLNLTGAANFLTVDGTTIAGAQTVDKVTVGTGVYFPGISFGSSFTLNSVKFAGAPYNQQTPQTAKDIMYTDSTGNVFDGDFSKPLDSQGYPSALSATPWGKKG